MATFGFTPASRQDFFSLEMSSRGSETTSSPLSGREARVFYENLMKDGQKKEPGERDRDVRLRNRGPNRKSRARSRAVQQRTDLHRGQSGQSEGSSQRSTMLQGLRLLRSAHEGDIPCLKDLLSKGVDINFQDSFFWTAVMCASSSGQRAAVRLLLQRGAAWVGVVDTQGRDAKDLAQAAGHREVVEELLGFGKIPRRKKLPESSPLQRWCEVCHSEYSDSPATHLSSTLHQFSLRRPPPAPYYCLPPSSNSYRMMVRSGWKPGTGLGPEGEGTKQPVPTVLKRDQTGLGYGQMKRAKVTHFQARDCDAVKHTVKTKEERGSRGQRKEESRKKEQRDNNWERDFRTSFYL